MYHVDGIYSCTLFIKPLDLVISSLSLAFTDFGVCTERSTFALTALGQISNHWNMGESKFETIKHTLMDAHLGTLYGYGLRWHTPWTDLCAFPMDAGRSIQFWPIEMC